MAYRGIRLKSKSGDYLLPLNYYRVGDLFLTTNSQNPSSFLGGSWELYGPGRTIVCVDTSQSEFNSVKKTGGAKTHTLTEAQIPSHTHIQNAHQHDYLRWYGGKKASLNSGGSSYRWNWDMTGNDNDGFTMATTTATNQNTGGGAAHNNLQPFITCYIWIRTA